ncbi:hypothetical protein K3495_g9315 [Podosphaera aphanis]|nr:hypothetical protein K3495_g9315 [Podosphaera aphanis]
MIHIVDEATGYQAARFLTNMTASTVWNAFRMCWIDVYLGLPDFVVHDVGTNFVSREFRQNAKSMGIQVREVPVEAHNSIGKFERYHGVLRRAYRIIHNELANQRISKEMMLQMAVKAFNDSVGPHRLIPTRLMYGAHPRLTQESAPSPSISARAEAIDKAMKQITQVQAKRRVRDALATRNGPNTSHITSVPLNSEVLVWRENRK